jgi:iron(III) transport system ATP-binding protein
LSQQYELPKFLRVEQVLKYANKLSAGEAERLFAVCRIDHLGSHRTDQLSGGERQRIALTKLLLASPKLLLLDEPFSNLDMVHKNILKAVIQDIGEQLQITCILISHDPQDTLSWADEILVLRGGQMQQIGSPRHIYTQPANEYVAGLFGRYNLLPNAGVFKELAAPPREKKSQKILIRPESFNLQEPGENGLNGTVKNIKYFGAYSEIEVVVAGVVISVRTSTSHLAPGDAVGVSVAPDAVWYV